jgi:predicted RNA binding protein YcfA (HicA-like mRNA interferase family)
MSKTIPLSAKKVIKELENMGLEQARQRGSHL